MSKIVSILMLIALLVPQVSSAITCEDEGYSIVYINGIYTDKEKADDDKGKIKEKFDKFSTHKNIKFHLGYNQTRHELDLIKATMQAYRGAQDEAIIDQDAKQILSKLHGDLDTKRFLLLGHSQGSFYTNAIAQYLLNNGINPSALAVYNIGTPASYVGGNRIQHKDYVTNKTDNVINKVREATASWGAQDPLPANVHISLQDNQLENESRGHDLRRVYLAGEGERIVAEVDAILDALIVPRIALEELGCYFEPELSWRDTVDKISLAGINSLIGGMYSAGSGMGTVAILSSKAVNKITKVFQADKSSKVVVTQESIQEPQKIEPPEEHQQPRQVQPVLKQQELPQFPKEATAIALDYSEMQALLNKLQEMLEGYKLALQQSDKCAGIDLSIIKNSNCIAPFDQGGYAYGAGGARTVACTPNPFNNFCNEDMGPPPCEPIPQCLVWTEN